MMRRLTILSLLFVLPVIFAQGVLAQNSNNPDRAVIEIIEVENRDPLMIKSGITGSLDPRGSIGVVDNKLIIASTASNFAMLRELVAAADIPLRRLVVSVDFDHSNPLMAQAQQSQQAIEGDVVSFVASAVDPVTPVAGLPTIQVHTSIRNNMADAVVEVQNVEGLAGRYQLALEPGRWYVINPAPETVEEFDFDPALDGAQELFETPVNGLPADGDAIVLPADPAPADAQPTSLPIAVRVDVLP